MKTINSFISLEYSHEISKGITIFSRALKSPIIIGKNLEIISLDSRKNY